MHKKILVLPGDGIGPEVVREGVKVLKRIADKFKHEFIFDEGLIGHAAIEATGNPLPDETLEKAEKSNAILFGAVGHPKYDNDPTTKVRPEQGLLKIRKELELFANIRPIKLFDALLDASTIKRDVIKGTDIIFFRELTGGIYFGQPRERRENGNVAVDTMIYSKDEVRRISKMAFETAKKRKKKVTSVDKSNVLECSRLWKEVVNEVAMDYPDVEVEHMFVDAMSMKLIQCPNNYDVILTENMFGDILTDEASQIAGSMGMLASASLGTKYALYEPIHGSAPKLTGLNKANPLATILSVQMMLDITFDMKEEAKAIENSINKVLEEGYRTYDIKDEKTEEAKVIGTKEMGELVARIV